VDRQGPAGDRALGPFGASNLFDIPVPGDYDNLGHTELAVFRPSTAQWIVRGPAGDHVVGQFGATNLFDIPVPGDYDGVGHAQLAVSARRRRSGSSAAPPGTAS